MNDSLTKAKVDLEELIGELAEQYTERLRKGEHPDVEEYAHQHPDVAEALRQILPALEIMGAAPVSSSVETNNNHKQLGQDLGDFRILQEIGRGGMGVVYEAEQLSLGRRVALKVLPFAAMLDKQQLNRFKNEARAAATLDHPNIVAVYSVGEQRGVHYYAMQLVEGQSLAEVIATRRQRSGISTGDADATIEHVSRSSPLTPQASLETKPVAALSTLPNSDTLQYFHTVAQLGIQAAQALDHAHQNGIVHRDVKPGNLLLDSEGKLYVTDFGLARIEADAGMTMTGDLLGTLAYMSPEQALAKRVVIDHRTDIYSLGVTLYELLTLEKPYEGSDRQELLRHIAFNEPRCLRLINPRVPDDLETIVGKAMEKSPDDRYATAQDLAADLQRYLTDQPIHAKRPSVAQQIAKWSRRHIAVVWSTVAVLFAFLLFLAGAAALIADSRNAAVADRVRAEEQRNSAVWQRNRAQLQQYYAEIVSSQSDLANGNLSRIQEKLLRHLPIGNEQDRRGWEWYYLQSVCHPEERTLHSLRNEVWPAWSPDGKYIATADYVWQSDTGECVRIHTPSLNLRKGIDWSPDSQLLAWGVASDDSAVYLWDRGTNEIRELRDHEASVWQVAFSPDGKRLASCSYVGAVRIWDLDSGQVRQTFEADGQDVSLAWSPDSTLLAVGANGLYIWSVADGEQVLRRPEEGGVHVSWSPDGSQLAVSARDGCHVLDCTDWTVLKRIHDTRRDAHMVIAGMHGCLAWSPSGERLAITNRSKIDVWNVDQNEITATLVGHAGHVNTIDWSPDGRRLVTSDGQDEVKIWDLRSPLQPPPIKTDAQVIHLHWGREENTLVSVDHRLTFTTWDVSDGGKIDETPSIVDEEDEIGKLSPDGRLRAHWSGDFPDPSITVRNAATGVIHSEWRSVDPHFARDFSWSPDSKRLAITVRSSSVFGHSTNTSGLECWDVDDERRISLWTRTSSETAPRLLHPTWSPDGARVAVVGPGDRGDDGSAYWSSHVHIVDVATGKRVLKRAFGNRVRYGGEIITLAWSPDGSRLAQGTTEGLVEIITPNSDSAAVHCRAHRAPITALAWNPDSQRLVIAASDGAVKLIEPRHGNEVLTFDVGDGGCSLLSWSADGEQLAAANNAGVIRCWDAARGYQFSPEGERRGELAWMYYRLADVAEDESRLECLRRVVELAPKSLGYRFLRGQCLARLGEYDRAAVEFAAATPDRIDNGMWMAIRNAHALIGARDITAYRELQKSLTEAGWHSEVWSKRLFPAWLGALIPDATERFEDCVEVLLAEEENAFVFELTLGAMLYRLHRFDEANEIFEKLSDSLGRSADDAGQYSHACAHYFLAMTRFQMGHTFQSQRLLVEADDIARKFLDIHSTRANWEWQVELATLQREAVAMIDK